MRKWDTEGKGASAMFGKKVKNSLSHSGSAHMLEYKFTHQPGSSADHGPKGCHPNFLNCCLLSKGPQASHNSGRGTEGILHNLLQMEEDFIRIELSEDLLTRNYI